ncbi:MAG: cytoplasmic iron level regulating protein YaaA (DUF328/UPF0246 family) [Paracoccaceae bacterium]|jgi:cytoplasmic iron level regulating protein YaaA (DUF328/UPF0246 family)
MLTVISPAKRLDFDPVSLKVPASLPEYQGDAVSLSIAARRLSVVKLRKLMAISQDLAKLNQGRFKAFEVEPVDEITKPAALAFAGDTYLGLEAGTLEVEELAYAQNHLRILSGLYGLLRPMDRIQPYRLEMGSRLATRRGKNLYQYWGARLAENLNSLATEANAKTLLNCASVEYFTAVKTDKLAIPVVTPVFLDMQKGEAKIISFFAKKARGAMARFAVQNRITEAADLKNFDTGGYVYQPAQSDPMRPVFLRDET